MVICPIDQPGLARLSHRVKSLEDQLKTLNRILTVAFLGLLGLVALLALVGLLLPNLAHVERSITIDAPPSRVFAIVNGFDRIDEWSPWHQVDPGARSVFEGPAAGEGARMTWASDHPRLGSGSQEITESVPHSRVTSTIDFGESGAAEASFNLEATPGGTLVTWRIETDLGKNIVARYFGLGFDRMLGPSCEQGLADLKALAESHFDDPGPDLEVTN